jgi:hypothetical protein
MRNDSFLIEFLDGREYHHHHHCRYHRHHVLLARARAHKATKSAVGTNVRTLWLETVVPSHPELLLAIITPISLCSRPDVVAGLLPCRFQKARARVYVRRRRRRLERCANASIDGDWANTFAFEGNLVLATIIGRLSEVLL